MGRRRPLSASSDNSVLTVCGRRSGTGGGVAASAGAELGAKKPMRVPRFIGRMFAGETGAVFMTEIRGLEREGQARPGGASPSM
jgi:hypothetical protein